jgi:hypothetical protein
MEKGSTKGKKSPKRAAPALKSKDELELRRNFKLLLLQNPDYFGNLTQVGAPIEGFAPVLTIASNTSFEELTCVSYNPESRELRGVVKIKQENGYAGGPCTQGSKEYVRFYVDYNRDGTWFDEGVVNFDAHDLAFDEDLCYGVKLEIDPKKRSCCNRDPVLPRVRAILSWNLEPPAGQPDWSPVWGNRVEVNIQIAPRTGIFCQLIDQLGEAIDPGKLEVALEGLEPAVSPPALEPIPPFALKQTYGDEVEGSRFAFKQISALAFNPSETLETSKLTVLQQLGIDIPAVIDAIIKLQFDTTYEEVKCVALNRDFSILHAAVQVKRPSGYMGNLCQEGSREYVAFYMDFGSGWEHKGTSSVRVHDIPEIPDDGLWYNVFLPVQLSEHQQEWCRTGKAKVRSILSWNAAPTPGDPDYVASWGDWEECYVEVKPLPAGVTQGEVVPVIEVVGGMPVPLIDASGLATGENPAGLRALDSPFDGRILINGVIFNAPNSSDPGVASLRYRILVKQPSHSGFEPWTGTFTAWVTEISGGIPALPAPVTRVPLSPDGWLDYLPDFIGPESVSVAENLLGVYRPSEEGLHEVKVEMYDPNTGATRDSNVVKFKVDRTRVEVDIEITSGLGNCGFFTPGDEISGTFSISDEHCKEMELSVTPAAEAHGARPDITPGLPVVSSLSYEATTLPGNGTSGTWRLDTSPMDVCGYNVRIKGVERTIINSRSIHRHDWDIEGFCLMETG